MSIACLNHGDVYFSIIWCFCSLCSCQKISRLWSTFSDNQTRNRNLQSGCQKNVSCTCWIIYKTFQFQAPLVKKKSYNERENEFLMSLRNCIVCCLFANELMCCFWRLWDPKIEEKITQDRIGMNLLYVQVRARQIWFVSLITMWKVYFLSSWILWRHDNYCRSSQLPVYTQIIIQVVLKLKPEKKIQVWMRFNLHPKLISQLLKLCVNCNDQSCLHIFLHFSNIWSLVCSLVCWSLVVDRFQAVSDLEKGWTVGSKEAHAKLAELKKKGDKLEVRLSHIQANYTAQGCH